MNYLLTLYSWSPFTPSLDDAKSIGKTRFVSSGIVAGRELESRDDRYSTIGLTVLNAAW